MEQTPLEQSVVDTLASGVVDGPSGPVSAIGPVTAAQVMALAADVQNNRKYLGQITHMADEDYINMGAAQVIATVRDIIVSPRDQHYAFGNPTLNRIADWIQTTKKLVAASKVRLMESTRD